MLIRPLCTSSDMGAAIAAAQTHYKTVKGGRRPSVHNIPYTSGPPFMGALGLDNSPDQLLIRIIMGIDKTTDQAQIVKVQAPQSLVLYDDFWLPQGRASDSPMSQFVTIDTAHRRKSITGGSVIVVTKTKSPVVLLSSDPAVVSVAEVATAITFAAALARAVEMGHTYMLNGFEVANSQVTEFALTYVGQGAVTFTLTQPATGIYTAAPSIVSGEHLFPAIGGENPDPEGVQWSHGGVVVGGSATFSQGASTLRYASAGGVIVGGRAYCTQIGAMQFKSAGGAIVGGQMDAVGVAHYEGSGGVIAGGDSINVKTAQLPSTGGAVAGGSSAATTSARMLASGGAITGGTGHSHHKAYRTGAGGVIVGGTVRIKKSQTIFIDVDRWDNSASTGNDTPLVATGEHGIFPDPNALLVGSTGQITAHSSAGGQAVYESSNPAVATIDFNGGVTLISRTATDPVVFFRVRFFANGDYPERSMSGGAHTFSLIQIPQDSVTFTINPSPIHYGEALAAVKSAPVLGTWELDPLEGTNDLDVTTTIPHSITATFTPTDLLNYAGSQTYDLPLNVVASVPVISWNPPDFVYGGLWANVMTATAYNPYNGASILGTFSYSVAGIPMNSASYRPPAATYTINVTFTPTGAKAGNHANTATAQQVVIVAKKTLTIVAAAKFKSYGATDPVLTCTVTGVVAGSLPTGALARTAGENVGTYVIGIGNLSYGPNYTIAFSASTLSITRVTIYMWAIAATKQFGAADPTLYFHTGDNIPSVLVAGASGVMSRTGSEEVGTYAVTRGTFTADGNHNLTFYEAPFTITQAVAGITSLAVHWTAGPGNPPMGSWPYELGPDRSLMYGDTGTVTATGTESSAAVSFSSSNTNVCTVGPVHLVSGRIYTATLVIQNAGAFVITASQAGDSGHAAAADVSTLGITVTKRILTVVATAVAKAFSTADPPLTYTATGLLTGDTISGALARAAGETAGNYAINQGTLTAGANYTIVFTAATLTISAGVTVLTVTAQAKTKVFGTGDPTLTYTVTGGSPAMTGTLARTAGEDAGTYAIGVGTLSAGVNYTINFVTAALTISKAALTVTAAAKVKSYGAADPVLTYTITGGSPAMTGALVRTAGENAGVYQINQGTLTAGSNYTISFIAATFTISVGAFTVIAIAATKEFGTIDPQLTYSIVGNGAVSGALARTPGEDAGTYSIGQGTLVAGGNYAMSFVGAMLTITQAVKSITSLGTVWNDVGIGATPTYIGQTGTITATGTGSTAAINFSSSDVNVCSVGAVTLVSAGVFSAPLTIVGTGTFHITASQGEDANYAVATTAQTADVVIAAAPPTAVSYSVTVLWNEQVGVSLNLNGAATRGSALTYVVDSASANSSTVITPAGGSVVTFRTLAEIVTQQVFTFTYRAVETAGGVTLYSTPATVTVTISAPLPISIFNRQYGSGWGTILFAGGSNSISSYVLGSFTGTITRLDVSTPHQVMLEWIAGTCAPSGTVVAIKDTKTGFVTSTSFLSVGIPNCGSPPPPPPPTQIWNVVRTYLDIRNWASWTQAYTADAICNTIYPQGAVQIVLTSGDGHHRITGNYFGGANYPSQAPNGYRQINGLNADTGLNFGQASFPFCNNQAFDSGNFFVQKYERDY